MPLVFDHFGNWGNEADKFLMICQRNLLTLKEDRTNMPLETDGGGIFQFWYRNVIVQSF